MIALERLMESAEALAKALDELAGCEDSRSKQIRRTIKSGQAAHKDTILKLNNMIDHEDGLLNSIDNELIQLCYATGSSEGEKARVETFITLLTKKTEFVKHLILTPNSSLIGFE